MSSESTGEDLSQQVAESNVATEAMVPQSKVTELVANARHVAAETARREMEAQFAKERDSFALNNAPAQTQSMSSPDLGNQVSEAVKREMDAQKQMVFEQQQRQQAEYLADEYKRKMSSPSELADFEKVTGKFNPLRFPHITLASATLDNTQDVIYDIMKNPMKLTHLQKLFEIDEQLGYEELKELSDSIKRNVEASQSYQKAPNPLSKPKASIAGADSGRKTIADWKKIWRT